jgi:hypothetical protein
MLYGKEDWEVAVSEKGLYATYNHLFGYPFDYAIEPLFPAILDSYRHYKATGTQGTV